MAIKTRRDFFQAVTGIATRRLLATSRMVSTLTGMQVQRNKAIVGENAFAHEAGIHQDGVLKERRTYEIMRPEDIGLSRSHLVLGKHSGRHALRVRARELGFKLTDDKLQLMFERFKALADKKKVVYDEDIEAILEDEFAQVTEVYRIESLHVSAGTHAIPTATLRLRGPKDETPQGRRHRRRAGGRRVSRDRAADGRGRAAEGLPHPGRDDGHGRAGRSVCRGGMPGPARDGARDQHRHHPGVRARLPEGHQRRAGAPAAKRKATAAQAVVSHNSLYISR